MLLLPKYNNEFIWLETSLSAPSESTRKKIVKGRERVIQQTLLCLSQTLRVIKPQEQYLHQYQRRTFFEMSVCLFVEEYLVIRNSQGLGFL